MTPMGKNYKQLEKFRMSSLTFLPHKKKILSKSVFLFHLGSTQLLAHFYIKNGKYSPGNRVPKKIHLKESQLA